MVVELLTRKPQLHEPTADSVNVKALLDCVVGEEFGSGACVSEEDDKLELGEELGGLCLPTMATTKRKRKARTSPRQRQRIQR